MRQDTSQDTALQLAIRLLFDGPRAHAVYKYLSTESVSPRLAASASKPNCTSTSPRCAGQLVAKAEASGKRESGCRDGKQSRARPAHGTYMHAHTANKWAGSCNVVLDSASFSISNAFVLAKSPVYFLSTCVTKNVGIAHKPLPRLQCENKRRQTHAHRPITVILAAHVRQGLKIKEQKDNNICVLHMLNGNC